MRKLLVSAVAGKGLQIKVIGRLDHSLMPF
jgi:hypothetical protein